MPRKPHRFRGAISIGLSKIEKSISTPPVINGFSVVTKGEALGHGLFLDDDFIDSVVKEGNKGGKGLKVRFTHPG